MKMTFSRHLFISINLLLLTLWLALIPMSATAAPSSWAVALLFWPDVGFWMMGMFVLLLITGMARSMRIVMSYR